MVKTLPVSYVAADTGKLKWENNNALNLGTAVIFNNVVKSMGDLQS